MAEGPIPKSLSEATPAIVWTILIFTAGFEFISCLVHAEWWSCAASFGLLVVMTAALIYWRQITRWGPLAYAVATLLIVMSVWSPLLGRLWPPPPPISSQGSSTDKQTIGDLQTRLNAVQAQLVAIVRERDALQMQVASDAQMASARIGERMLINLEMKRRLVKAFREYGKKPIIFSFTSPPENEQYKNAVYEYVVDACHTSEAACTIEPIIDKSGGIPIIDQPAKIVPTPQYPGIVLHHIPGAETDKLFGDIAVSFGCAIIRRSVTMPEIIEEANITHDPNLFWIEIGYGYPLNSNGCQ